MDNTIIPPPDTTMRPPTRPSSNGAADKLEGGGDGRGMLVKNPWNVLTVRMMYVACNPSPPHMYIKFQEGHNEEGTSRENGGGTTAAPFGGVWGLGRRYGRVSTDGGQEMVEKAGMSPHARCGIPKRALR